jgi:mRNA-degrading endonuclease toxin of MazEF toxin-antitoxin module
MKRGTIILTFFPFTDLSSSKRRPAVIISRDNKKSEDVVVAYISSQIPDKLLETDFILEKQNKSFIKTGLIKESVFRMSKIVTISDRIISGELGYADRSLMNELDKKLKLALDLV